MLLENSYTKNQVETTKRYIVLNSCCNHHNPFNQLERFCGLGLLIFPMKAMSPLQQNYQEKIVLTLCLRVIQMAKF